MLFVNKIRKRIALFTIASFTMRKLTHSTLRK